jgi:3-dehydroquinate synthase
MHSEAHKQSVQFFLSIEKLREHIPSGKKLVLADSNTPNCVEQLNLHLKEDEVLIVPAGDGSKSLETAQTVWDRMLQLNLSRTDHIICVGGGVITDLGAFCGSTFKRGINIVHVPTSLLGMVDASIGGKTGINYKGFKNYIGTFQVAENILVCPEFLETLSQDELRSGYGELYKHALIAGGDLWQKLIEQNSVDLIPSLQNIQGAIIVKQDIVSADFRENNNRKKLNLGHTLAHALESVSFTSGLHITHGDAVIAGIIIESLIAVGKGKLQDKTFEEISNHLIPLFPKISWADEDVDEIIRFAQGDKKTKSTSINCSLLVNFSLVEIDCEVSAQELISALNQYKNGISSD